MFAAVVPCAAQAARAKQAKRRRPRGETPVILFDRAESVPEGANGRNDTRAQDETLRSLEVLISRENGVHGARLWHDKDNCRWCISFECCSSEFGDGFFCVGVPYGGLLDINKKQRQREVKQLVLYAKGCFELHKECH